MKNSESVHEAALDQAVDPLALHGHEAGGLGIVIRVLEIDLPVGRVEIAAHGQRASASVRPRR